MIYDSIENCATYANAHKGFAEAFEFLKKLVAGDVKPGRHTLNDEIYANVSTYATHDMEPVKAEYHKKYIDLQYVVSGEEWIFAPDIHAKNLTDTVDYQPGDDYGLKTCPAKDGANLTMSNGYFAIFFPEEPHWPGVSKEGKAQQVKKIVVKIPM